MLGLRDVGGVGVLGVFFPLSSDLTDDFLVTSNDLTEESLMLLMTLRDL